MTSKIEHSGVIGVSKEERFYLFFSVIFLRKSKIRNVTIKSVNGLVERIL